MTQFNYVNLCALDKGELVHSRSHPTREYQIGYQIKKWDSGKYRAGRTDYRVEVKGGRELGVLVVSKCVKSD
jgi:hypothetical protein